jgi:hypothetical protein
MKTEVKLNENLFGYMDVHGDAKKYFCKKNKINVWVLGYFGGGSFKVGDITTICDSYADLVDVPIESIKMGEIRGSRRFAGFKFIYSEDTNIPEGEAEEIDNVFGWLND